MENNGRNGFLFRYDLINELIAEGLILSFEFNRNNPIHIEYKNEQIKRCLTKSGQVLELIVYLLACEAREKNGNPTYNDVMTSVFIDWDGEVHDGNEKNEAENEVDVIMMRGMVPIFVSCKNGNVTVDELYKLYSVAYKFGGKYAKKVLIAPRIEGNANVNALRERCSDMQIRIIDNVEDMNEDKLQKTIKGFWSQYRSKLKAVDYMSTAAKLNTWAAEIEQARLAERREAPFTSFTLGDLDHLLYGVIGGFYDNFRQ